MHGGDSLFGRMATTTHVYRDSIVDPELDHKANKVTEKMSESINTIANEPSVAFYRIQEHVRKTLPQLVERKHDVEEVQQQVQGACFDTEYAGNAVKIMQKSVVHFQNIQELLKNAMFMKQQIDYEDARKRQNRSPAGAGRPELQAGNKAEEGTSNMADSTVSTDSSLVASGHANTEADDGDTVPRTAEAGQLTENENPLMEGNSGNTDVTEPVEDTGQLTENENPWMEGNGGDTDVTEPVEGTEQLTENENPWMEGNGGETDMTEPVEGTEQQKENENPWMEGNSGGTEPVKGAEVTGNSVES